MDKATVKVFKYLSLKTKRSAVVIDTFYLKLLAIKSVLDSQWEA